MVDRWQGCGSVAGSVIGILFLIALSAAPCQADDYRVKYTYDNSTNKVLTNVGQGTAFPDAQSGQMRGQSNYVKKIQAQQREIKKIRAALKKAAEAEEKKAAGTGTPAGAGSTGASSASSTSARATSTSAASSSVTSAGRSTAKKTSAAKSASRSGSVSAGRTVVDYSAGNIKIQTVNDNVLPPPRVEYGYSPSSSGEYWAFSTFDASKRKPRLTRYYGWHRDETGREVQGWYDVDLNPLILSASKAAGVDPLLVEIVMRHESNFNPYARSPVGAVGLMQLMPDTAGGLGVSDVFNVRDNIRGGAQYIAYQLARFNSVPLALAAYNAGPGAVIQYGGVPPYAETQNYVRMIYGEYQAALRKRNAER